MCCSMFVCIAVCVYVCCIVFPQDTCLCQMHCAKLYAYIFVKFHSTFGTGKNLAAKHCNTHTHIHTATHTQDIGRKVQ